jgi:hypothetical protein
VAAAAALGEPAVAAIERLAGHAASAPRPAWVDSACAGTFLLLRAILDARLPATVRRAGVPAAGTEPAIRAVVLGLALRWSGPAGTIGGELDPGLALLAGIEPAGALDWLRAQWSAPGAAEHLRLQREMLRTAAGQGLLAGGDLHVHAAELGTAGMALVGSDGTPGVWPLGRPVASPREAPEVVRAWLDACEAATGRRPDAVARDERLAGVLGGASFDERAETDRQELLGTLAALDAGRLGIPQADLTLALCAAALLRLWARWLRGFAGSSAGYLLERFVRRPGRIARAGEELTVVLPPAPLDVVLEMAGYAGTCESDPALGHRRVHLLLGGP